MGFLSIPRGKLEITIGTGLIIIHITENIHEIAGFFFKQFMSVIEIPKDKPSKPMTLPYICISNNKRN